MRLEKEFPCLAVKFGAANDVPANCSAMCGHHRSKYSGALRSQNRRERPTDEYRMAEQSDAPRWQIAGFGTRVVFVNMNDCRASERAGGHLLSKLVAFKPKEGRCFRVILFALHLRHAFFGMPHAFSTVGDGAQNVGYWC